MDEKELILTGQGETQNVPKNLDTSIANDLIGQAENNGKTVVGPSIGKYGTGSGAKPTENKISKTEQQKIANINFIGGMSGRIKGMLNSPGFVGDNGMYDTDQIENRRNIAWIPELYENTLNKNVAYTQDFTSSTPTIIKDSAKQFWMSLGTLGDKALIGLGGLTSKVTGGEFGTELRDRAYDTLESKLYNIGLESTEIGDVETWTSKITMGAASMLEMIGLGIMTGGIAPLAQMGVDVFGDGTYNNMKKYAEENNGSIEGYEGNWIDIGVDLANATAQVVIERKFGLGSSRFLRGAGGHFIKEGISGFMQESSQEFLSDFGEYIKGNESASIMMERWQDYLVAGVIGGILQGGLGAATYKVARMQADANAAQLYKDVVGRANPNISEDQLHRDSRAFAKSVNDRMEKEIAVDVYDELAQRVDANNDRGKLRDYLVGELSKARATSLGLKDPSELSEQDLLDIQDAATVIAKESVRMAWAEGVSILDTPIANIYADGSKLKVRGRKEPEKDLQEVAGEVQPTRSEQIVQRQKEINTKKNTRSKSEEVQETQPAQIQDTNVEQAGQQDISNNYIEQSYDVANENARLDDIYPEYTGETIEINGVERTVYNSNGERIAKSAEALRNFYNWFGNSKVVDERGRPLVVYHGRRSETPFDTFRQGVAFFTNNRDVAQVFSDEYAYNLVVDGQKIPLDYDTAQHLSEWLSGYDYGIDDVIRWHNFADLIKERGQESYEDARDSGEIQSGNLDSVDLFGANDIHFEIGSEPISVYLKIENPKIVDAKNQEWLAGKFDDSDMIDLSGKYDGSIIKNIREGGPTATMRDLSDVPIADDYIVYSNTQIKSVDNRGTFSADTGNIYFQQALDNINLKRGSYNSRYQEIILNKDSDISTILHEFAHLWLNSYFKAMRAENAPESFVKMWSEVEKALGIRKKDRFLDKDISEKFARGFEKFVIEGGKGAPESLKPAYERLSVRLANIYDDLSTKYFDMVQDLKPEVKNWFAWNEILSETFVGAETKDIEKTTEPIENLYEKATVSDEPVSQRAKERSEAMKEAQNQIRMEGDAKKQADALNEKVEDVAPAELKEDSDEKMSSPYTSEGKKERAQSKKIRNMAEAQGILIDARSEYNPYLSKAAAEDAAMLVKMDYEKAKNIAMGRIPPEGGIEAETMFIAVRNQALLNNDAYTLKLLQSSPIQARITEAAQRLSLVRNYTGSGENNVIKALNDIQKIYDKRIDAKSRAEIDKQVKRLNDLIERFDLDSEPAWKNLLKEMECH